MNQVTALFEFLQHIWFPQRSLIAFVWFVVWNFWLEYQYINDNIVGDSMVAMLDFWWFEILVHFKSTSE